MVTRSFHSDCKATKRLTSRSFRVSFS
jgi:hypothetical protein